MLDYMNAHPSLQSQSPVAESKLSRSPIHSISLAYPTKIPVVSEIPARLIRRIRPTSAPKADFDSLNSHHRLHRAHVGAIGLRIPRLAEVLLCEQLWEFLLQH